MYYLYILIFTCLISYTKSSLSIQKRQACDNTWTLCLPTWNQTWYHYNHYKFIWNQNYTLFVNNNISTFDLHLLTLSSSSNKTERTVKSWFNLTNNVGELNIQVTDDWFPKSLPNGASNTTWTLYAFLLPHDAILPPMDLSNTSSELNSNEPYVQFNVVQSPPTPIIINKERLAHKWILAIIIIACVIVIIAICIIVWLLKNMQKMKKKSSTAAQEENNPYQLNNNSNMMMHQSSILSTPDAMMIADTFRQVMSTSDLDKKRNQVGDDLLRRQLESEGTSVLEVERRTSSTKTKKRKS